MYIVTSDEMREIDEKTIREYGVSGGILMENAAINTLMAMQREFGPVFYRKVCVFCMPGNNGGDGMALARHLKNEGAIPKIFLAGDPEKVKGEARVNFEAAKKYGIEIENINSEKDLEKYRYEIMSCDIIVDALIGLGLKKDIEGFPAKLMMFLNALGKPIVSVDVPAGVDADTGAIKGAAIRAALTVTFGLPKRGLCVYPGLDYTGKLVVSDISLPQELLNRPRQGVLITRDMAVPMLPAREQNANKGHFGPILIIGGAPGMSGAVTMAAKAALKSGAGVVMACVPAGVEQVIKSRLDEVITIGLPQTPEGYLSEKSFDRIAKLSEKAKVVALGPGLGRAKQPFALARKIVGEINRAMVVDADGLNAVSENKKCLKNLKKDVILTPHIGEMARLASAGIEDVIRDKIKILKEFITENPVNVLLKDGRSMVMDTDFNLYVNTTGNPGMATPGSGDVLTGLTAALMAHGIPAAQAGIAANYVHGFSGDILSPETGEEGMIASDIIEGLPKAFKKMRTQEA